MKLRALVAIIAVATALFAGMETARGAEKSPFNTVEVTGHGEAHGTPDIATLSFTVETSARTATRCAGQNAALADRVVKALSARLGGKGKVWTGGYALSPEYSNPRPPVSPEVIGYRARNSITVKTDAFDLLGPLIDAAVGAGANRVNFLEFGLENDTEARGEAITMAAKDAVAQAHALAAALGVKLGPVLKASTVVERQWPRPVYQARAMTMGAVQVETPITPSEVTVPATVSLVYRIQ